jgi:hypothetical protein
MHFARDDKSPGAFTTDFSVAGQPPPLPPAMTAGKGVRAVRCVGCRHDTLPRPDDGAPLCLRCSEVLAAVEEAPPETWAAWTVQLTPKWLRRRSSVPF